MRAVLVLLMLVAAAPAWSGERRDGRALMALDRFAEAAAAFARAGDRSPAHAAALIRLGRLEEARALAGDDLLAAVDAFVLAGEWGRARDLLAAGLADQPDEVALLRRLGELELVAGRPLRALAPLGRAAELAPADAGVRRGEVRALAAAGLPVRAAQAAEAARRSGVVDSGLLAAELAARQAYGDHRGVIDAAEAHDTLVAAEPALARLLADSLDAIGARARAAHWRKEAATSVPAVPDGEGEPALGEQARHRALDLLATERWDDAAAAVLDWAGLRPDDDAAVAALLRPEIARRVGWAAAFAGLGRLLARDPEDPARHLLACDLHAEPPGNELMVLAHAHAVERLVGADDPRVARARGLRDQALERLARLGRLVDLDLAAARAVVERPSGERVEVTVDPATGRLLRVVVGGRWIEAQWSGGALAGLVASSGVRLRPEWRDGRLARLVREGGSDFRAEFGAHGEVAILRPPGVGEGLRDAVALVTAWPETDVGGAIWLRLE